MDLDISLLKFIHSLHSDSYNNIFIALRNPFFWTPFYAWIITWLIINKTEGLRIVLMTISTFIVSDQLSSSLLKPLISRIRPCNNSDVASFLDVLVPCGSGFSMPSSHAFNHFALSVFLMHFIYEDSKSVKSMFLLWAFSVSFSQVYVGVHYPSDVIIGAILGTFVGLGMTYLTKQYILAK